MSNSSISSSKSTSLKPVLVGFLLTVILLELFARRYDFFFDGEAGWSNQRLASVVAFLPDAEDAPEVLFIGSSQVMLAVDPIEFSSITGRSSFNSGVVAGRPEVLEPWLYEVVMSDWQSPTVVILVSPWDLNDGNIPQFTPEELRAAPGYRLFLDDRWRADVERWLNDHSALFRHRQSFRDPELLRSAVIGGEFNELSVSSGRAGTVLNFPPYSTIQPSLTELGISQYSITYEIGGLRSQSLSAVIGRLRSEGTEVLLVSAPVHRESFKYLEGGCADLAKYRNELATIEDITGVRVINAEGAIPGEENFFDPIHVTRAGREAFTRWLASEMEDPGGDPPSVLDRECGFDINSATEDGS